MRKKKKEGGGAKKRTIPPELDHHNLGRVVQQEPDDPGEELVVGHAGDGAVLEVGLVGQVLAHLVVDKGGAELKVAGAQRQHGGQVVLLRNGQPGDDVGREGGDGGARQRVGDLRQGARVPRVVRQQGAHDGAARVAQDGVGARRAVHAHVVRGRQDEAAEGPVALRGADGRDAAEPVGVGGRHGDVALVAAGQQVVARAGAVEAVRDDQVWILDNDGGGVGHGRHGALADGARKRVDLVPLLREDAPPVQDLEGEAPRLGEEARDVGGVDLERAVPELAECRDGDGLARHRELDADAGHGDVRIRVYSFAWHLLLYFLGFAGPIFSRS